MKAEGKKKKRFSSTYLIILILIAGLSLLLYPTVSNYWNSYHSSVAISDYSRVIDEMDDGEYLKHLTAAQSYNADLSKRTNTFLLTPDMKARYEDVLDIMGTGMMGYIEIPSINVSIPIYHGTSDATLQVAIGHLDWSSLPIGGKNTHCVLSGHRGLPSARLFTDLDKLNVGDIFTLNVLNDVYTYEVDNILITLPHETDSLRITEDADLCTLITCTPYGINSHRLLVRGHRIENLEEAKVARVTADAIQIEPMIIAPIVAIPMLLTLLIVLILKPKKKKTVKSIKTNTEPKAETDTKTDTKTDTDTQNR